MRVIQLLAASRKSWNHVAKRGRMVRKIEQYAWNSEGKGFWAYMEKTGGVI